ncbi:MAG: S9 family peptidase, partial [Acidobacteria bacterium]|nr:S9 family peptidase [Acidobacteriota bacterium]
MRRAFPFLLLAVCLPSIPTAAEEAGAKRAFEIADFYRAAFLQAQDVSPDGRWAVLAARHYRLEKGEQWSDLWRVDLESGEVRQLTFGEHDDSSPVFSPDGKSLVFVSDRGGDAPQLWAMATDGGGERQLTSFSMGVSDPVFSPDGRYLAVTSEVYPECGADSECNEKIQTAWEDGPLKAHLADSLLYRHWTSWSDGRYPHVLLVEAASGKVLRDLTPWPRESPTFSASGPEGYAFSPDSKELCFVSNPDVDAATSTNADLWSVSVEEEGAPVNLTGAHKGWDAHPVYSPDGSQIAFLSMERPGYEADLTRLAILDRKNGEIRFITGKESFDNPIQHLAWSADGKSLFFDALHHGRNPLFRLNLASKKIEEVLRHSTLDAWQIAPNGKSVIYTRRAIDAPTELYRAALGGGAPERLTRFYAELEAEVDLRPPEELWIEGEGGRKIHTFLIKPHGFDPSKKYPLILNVHGGPQGMWADNYRGDWQVYPGKGYVLAFPNPTGSTGYGQDVTDGIHCDWGGRVYRDLMKVTDQLEQLPYVDKEKVGAMGWSYGGYMMMWFEGHTDRFEAIVSMMGLYDLPSFHGATEEVWFPEWDLCGQPWSSEHYRKWSPSESVANFKTPALVITGEKDYRVPYTQSLQFFTALKR